MKLGLGMLAAAALVGSPLLAAGQAGDDHDVSLTRTRSQTITATVQAVDLGTRLVTLKLADGKPFTIRASDKVKNLPQVKVGDVVYVDYYESVAIYVSKPDGGGTYSGSSTSVDTAKPGQKPGAAGVKEVTIVAIVAQT